MKSNHHRVIMEAAEIQKTIEKMAAEIVSGTRNKDNLLLVGIHTGGVYLAERLRKIIADRFGLLILVGSLDITLYRDDWTRLHIQPMVKSTDMGFPIDDREVVLVDDVLYTGRTIRAALDALIDYGRPKSVRVAAFVDRGHRELPICGQFIGIDLKTTLDEQVNLHLVEKDGFDRLVVEKTEPS